MSPLLGARPDNPRFFSAPNSPHRRVRNGTGSGTFSGPVGEEHPVTYISRKLLSNEKNYSTVEKEALANKNCIAYYKIGWGLALLREAWLSDGMKS